jgi:3'(2'), 5'-bisphosphate nucleotidase
MEQKILKELLEAAKVIAVAAGEAILKVSSEGIDVKTKEDGSPLTRADTASHKIIESGLRQLEPIFPIISEEGNLKEVSMENLEIYWLIDPLDGTKEFVKGLDEYTVNIALIENSDSILGVIYVPVPKILYYAAKGLGAWKVGREETELFLNRLGIKEVIKHGSSLKMCAVAEDSADIYPRFGPTCLWDTGAGTAIAKEAGCVVVDLQGKELRYNPKMDLKQYGFIVYPQQLRILLDQFIMEEGCG